MNHIFQMRYIILILNKSWILLLSGSCISYLIFTTLIEHLIHFTILGIGIIITSNAATTSAYFLSVAILQALAGGTIIYVVVFEVLERERSKNVSGLAQLFFVILGFCVLMAVELLGKYQ